MGGRRGEVACQSIMGEKIFPAGSHLQIDLVAV